MCDICNRCRLQKARCRKRIDEKTFAACKKPTKFADLLTADHEVIAERNPDNKSRHDDKYAIIIQDWKTTWIDPFPSQAKTADDTLLNFKKFLRPGVIPKAIYSDSSKEVEKAVHGLGSLPATCTPHIPQTDGIADNSVRRVKEGTSCLLTQSGL